MYGYRGPSLIGILYLVVGVIVAADRNSFRGVNNIEEVVEALLAVFLWPLVLLGIDMRF
jgi:hypothetical protein